MRLAREALNVGTGGVYEAASAGILGTVLLEELVAAGGYPDPGQVDLAVELLTRACDGMSPADPQHAAGEASLSHALGLRSLLNGDVPGLRGSPSPNSVPPTRPCRPPPRTGPECTVGSPPCCSPWRPGPVTRTTSSERSALPGWRSRMAWTAIPRAPSRRPCNGVTALWQLGVLDLAGEGYAAALRILHDLTRTQLTAAAKDAGLARARDVTARAAVALAYAGRPGEAALAVETGRAVALSEALGIEQARILDVAARSHPLLVQAYQEAAAEVRRLQRDPASGLAARTLNLAQAQLDDQAALRAARQALDAAISALEQAMGVELLRPPTQESLPDAVRAAGMPVVYLVASEIGGSAVIAEPGGPIRPVRLPALTESRVSRNFTGCGCTRRTMKTMDSADRAAHLMWTDAMAPVVASLRGQPQAVLVPVGGLGILPLHAAGWQDADGTWHYAADIVSLGYAPNARVLAVCSQRAGRLPGRPALLVADPQTGEYLDPLPSAIDECEELRRRLPEVDVIAHLYRGGRHLDESTVLPSAGRVDALRLSRHDRSASGTRQRHHPGGRRAG